MQKQAKIGRADINRHASRAAAGLVLGAASLQPATAQTDSQPQVASTQQADDIVVTASRVNRSGFQAPTPTTILSADAIRDTGATNIGALSINLPQMTSPVGPANSSTVSGGGGQSFNLRALGSQRTLFLVDSHRHVPSTSSGLVDTNIVPSAIVERIEVVTGGASAAWGSDAIAGVVNVILRKDFQGLEAEALRGGSTRGDADELKLALTYGTSFGGGRGNIMIAGEYEDNDGVAKQSDRPWSKGRWGIVNNPQYTGSLRGSSRRTSSPTTRRRVA